MKPFEFRAAVACLCLLSAVYIFPNADRWFPLFTSLLAGAVLFMIGAFVRLARP